jgi:hypothetical protein
MQGHAGQPVLSESIFAGPAPFCFREQVDDPGRDSDVDVADANDTVPDRGIRCGACGFLITSRKEQCSRDGKHLHTFFNPAGIVYEIGCFSNAPGCLVYGPHSREFAWFAGYSWQICYCNECVEHLGWYFTTGDNAFFGLIVNRLQED